VDKGNSAGRCPLGGQNFVVPTGLHLRLLNVCDRSDVSGEITNVLPTENSL
jgi:hypothetical protein